MTSISYILDFWDLCCYLILTEQQEVDEHDFLNEICLAALSADKKSVRFAAVVDDNGKLLAAEYARNRFFENNYDSVIIKSSIFYLYYLIPAIKQCQQQQKSREGFFSSLLNLEDPGNNVYLVVTTLTERKDRYLCIYVQSYPSSKIITYGQIISKMSSTF
jgi:hypothetical protein